MKNSMLKFYSNFVIPKMAPIANIIQIVRIVNFPCVVRVSGAILVAMIFSTNDAYSSSFSDFLIVD